MSIDNWSVKELIDLPLSYSIYLEYIDKYDE